MNVVPSAGTTDGTFGRVDFIRREVNVMMAGAGGSAAASAVAPAAPAAPSEAAGTPRTIDLRDSRLMLITLPVGDGYLVPQAKTPRHGGRADRGRESDGPFPASSQGNPAGWA